MKISLPALLLLSLANNLAYAQFASVPSHLLALQRSDWGSEVLLCLANPNGPTAVGECRPPIERLQQHLRRGDRFPVCTMVGGSQGNSYATLSHNLYDPRPSGTSELAAGQIAVLASPMTTLPASPYRSGAPTTYVPVALHHAYFARGEQSWGGNNRHDRDPPVKVCVSRFAGTQWISQGDDPIEAQQYQTIYVQEAARSPEAMDVYVENSLWHRVRW